METSYKRRIATAALFALLAGNATAAEMDFSGYFRSGAGSSNKGGKEVCYRLPGSVLWFRLGNECDTYADLMFKSVLGEVDGTTFKSTFRFSYGTQGIANWEQTSPSFREVFVEAKDIGAAMNMPALRGASLWAGKRFYGNRDIHMLDYGFWEPNQGVGAGLENVDVGIGKFSYALMRIGDFSGYGVNPALGGYNPDLIGGGSRTQSVHDFRLEDIATNAGGKLMLGLDVSLANNRDGRSTYTSQTSIQALRDAGVDLIDATGKVVDTTGLPGNLLVTQYNTIDNKPGKNGIGLHIQHRQDDFLGLGGFNEVVLKYAKNAMTLRGYGIAGSTERRREWMLFDQWIVEPKSLPISASMTAGIRSATVDGVTGKEFWIGARPQYHINNIWSLMSEVGYQQAKSDGDTLGTRKLAKLTIGTQFSMGRSIWSRPAIRFYGTYAKWNDAAAAAGSVTCTGRDCNTPVEAYADRRSGITYGVQIEGWF